MGDTTPSIVKAARDGDLDKLRAALNNGADGNARDALGCTAAMWASGFSHIGCLNALLRAGADVNAVGGPHYAYDGTSALVVCCAHDTNTLKNGRKKKGAASSETVECLRLLQSRGADANAVAGDGATALYNLLQHNPSVWVDRGVEALLDKSASGNKHSITFDNHTCLFTCVDNGHLNCCAMLLERNCDVSARVNGYGGDDVLAYAASRKKIQFLEILLKHYTVDSVNDALLSAAQNRTGVEKMRSVELLLKHGANVNHASKDDGVTSLMHCAEVGNAELLQFLLRKGADVHKRCKKVESYYPINTDELDDAEDEDGPETAIAFVREGEHSKCVEILLKHGAEP